jgi:hypothetical protein
MHVISALRRLKQENSEFKANLGYISKPCIKKRDIMFGVIL